MVKPKTKTPKRALVVRPSPPHDDSSTPGPSHYYAAGAQAEEPRVPPLPELPPPPSYPREREPLSYSQRKLLSRLQMPGSKGGPGHMKLRSSYVTQPTESRVPPPRNVSDVIERLFVDPGPSTSKLPSTQSIPSVSSNPKFAPLSPARINRSNIEPPATPGQVKRRLDLALSASIKSATKDLHSDSSEEDFGLPIGKQLPSLIFSKASEGERDSSQQSPMDGTGTAQCKSNKGFDEVTSAKLRKIAGKFEMKKDAGSEPDDEEMDISSRAFKNIGIEDEEMVSESSPQVSHTSEISDPTNDDQINLGNDGAQLVSTEPHVAHEDLIVSTQDVGKSDSSDDPQDIPPDSIMAVEVVPILNILNNASSELKAALEMGGSGLAADELRVFQITNIFPADGQEVSHNQSEASCQLVSDNSPDRDSPSSVVCGQVAAGDQQKAFAQARKLHSDVKSDDTLVEHDSTISGHEKVADEKLEASTNQKTVSSQEENEAKVADGQSALSPPKKVHGQEKSDEEQKQAEVSRDEEQKQVEVSLEGASAVERSEKKGAGEFPVAKSKDFKPDGEEAKLVDEMITNFEDYQFPLLVPGKSEDDTNAPPVFDTKPGSHRCPAELYCPEIVELRSHLVSCRKPFCKAKHCCTATQVMAHGIHCVDNCDVCPAPGENDAERVREKIKRLSKAEEATEPTLRTMEKSTIPAKLEDFLTLHGQNIVLGFYVEYFYEAFVAYNSLMREAGAELRALEVTAEGIPETFMERVRHSSECLPLSNCREMHCHRLRMVIAHWSKWNGLCFLTECGLCTQIFNRVTNEKSEIRALVELIKGEVNPKKLNSLKAQLNAMVRKPPEVEQQGRKRTINWKDSSRVDVRNGCVNFCLFDAGHGEAKKDEIEDMDLESVFNKHLTYQLLMLSRYVLYKAIKLREEQIFNTSCNTANYYKRVQDEGLKMVLSVRALIQKELSLFDNPWENGNEIMGGYNMTENKRYKLQLSFKMGNRMVEFANSV